MEVSAKRKKTRTFFDIRLCKFILFENFQIKSSTIPDLVIDIIQAPITDISLMLQSRPGTTNKPVEEHLDALAQLCVLGHFLLVPSIRAGFARVFFLLLGVHSVRRKTRQKGR